MSQNHLIESLSCDWILAKGIQLKLKGQIRPSEAAEQLEIT